LKDCVAMWPFPLPLGEGEVFDFPVVSLNVGVN